MTVPLEHAHYWTADDVMALPPSDARYEALGGTLLVNPPPTEAHQTVARRLANRWEAAAPAGYRIVEAIGLRIGDDLAIPDVVLLTPDAPRDVAAHEARHVEAVAEIVSRGSTGEDRVAKRDLYAGAGIGWYWRVEPNHYRGRVHPLPVVHVNGLSELAEYSEIQVFGAGTTATVNEPFPVTLDPADLTD